MSEIGYVDSVRVDTDNKRVLLTVFLDHNRSVHDVPFRAPMEGMWIVPKQGQAVEVYETDRGRKSARFPFSVPDYAMPSLNEGDIAITVADDTQVIIRDNGDIDIDAGGTINIDAATNVNIDGIDFDAHTHDYEDELSDGSTTTKTTQGPQ